MIQQNAGIGHLYNVQARRRGAGKPLAASPILTEEAKSTIRKVRLEKERISTFYICSESIVYYNIRFRLLFTGEH
jgi:hypothetical protein